MAVKRWLLLLVSATSSVCCHYYSCLYAGTTSGLVVVFVVQIERSVGVCVPVCLGISLQQRSNEPTFGLRYILHVGYNHCRHRNHLKISSITM